MHETDASHSLIAAADVLWKQVRQVQQPIGEGGKAFYPYSLRGEVRELVRGLEQPLATYEHLLSVERDPAWRETLLFLIAATPDPRADALLLRALDDPGVRPRAIYLLGVIGNKGWPTRERDTTRILAALVPYLDDKTTYSDILPPNPLFQVGDFAKAAYIRIAGPGNFPEIKNLEGFPDDPEGRFIGLTLPTLSDHDRDRLSTAIRRRQGGETVRP